MSISYDRVNWQDYPGTNTPLAAQNLNKMDVAIHQLVEAVNAIAGSSGGNTAPPVGHIILNMNNRNPGLDYPGTTWTQIASGRALAGVGSYTDSKGFTITVGAGQTMGEVRTTEVVEHSHYAGDERYMYSLLGNNVGTDVKATRVTKGTSKDRFAFTASAQAYLTARVQNVGTGQRSVLNVQPTIGVYVWQRTA